ncbi:hypothetical protein [Micavibrio aeruginosavorus]|uniref:hypothetical protein n=1 Tax=Micavibrio aeruginosavorus TaxID=349221 RepID=UPI003F4AE93B
MGNNAKKGLLALGLAFAMAGTAFAAEPQSATDSCRTLDARGDLLQCFNAIQSDQGALNTAVRAATGKVSAVNLQSLEYKRRLDADCKKQAFFKAFLVFEASGWAQQNTQARTASGLSDTDLTRNRLHGHASFGAECHVKTAMWMKAYAPLNDAAASHRAEASEMRALAQRLKPKP